MKKINRREFIYCSAAILCSQVQAHAKWPFPGSNENGADIRGHIFRGDAPDRPWKWSKEAYHYKKVPDEQTVCGICPHTCIMAPGDRSVCRSRVNIDGTLYSLVYGNPCAVHVDPIEKKPLYHFLPGSRSFSIATTGCNLRCLNCQNWEISQSKPHEVRHVELFPKEVARTAVKSGCASVAYTYSEPITFYEYTTDSAREVKRLGMKNILISAGYINEAPLVELCRLIDGANINLKSFSDDIYRKLNGARLDPTLETFKTLHANRVHFEMTNLVVPGYVDDPDMVKRMCGWILDNLGPNYPLHFSRFFPKYKLDRIAPTPISTLESFREIAMRAGIRYVYLGNVPGHESNNTRCHQCGKTIIRRKGYRIAEYHLENGSCKFCGADIPGVW
jgi:pyruvate formate lyase activating enzyme